MTDVIKVVFAEEVENLTRLGWALVEVLGNASQPYNFSTLLRPSGNDSHGIWQSEVYRNDTVAIVRPLFVLRKDIEVLAREDALFVQVAKLDADLKTALGLHKSAEDAATTAASDAKNAREQLRFAEGQRENAMKDLDKAKTINTEHQTLLNRIRRELGDAKWRELEGSHSTCVLCIEAQR